jgi:hypothetical protein
MAHRICRGDLDITTANNASYECYVDMHEVQMTNRGTILVASYNVTQADLRSVNGSQNGWVLDLQFREVNVATGEVLLTWKYSDHLDQMLYNQSHYPLSIENAPLGEVQAFPWDAFHINSIQALDDVSLLSSRHYWTIYKFNKNGTMEWQLQVSIPENLLQRIDTDILTQVAKDDGHDFYTLLPGIVFHWLLCAAPGIGHEMNGNNAYSSTYEIEGQPRHI